MSIISQVKKIKASDWSETRCVKRVCELITIKYKSIESM